MDFIFNDYNLRILISVGIYIIMALGLNLITGVTGQLSLGHAAFMSIGAYTSALISMKLGLPFGVALLAGALMASFFGVLVGFPTLRLTGDYLAIATLGFAEIVRVLLVNMQFTGGALGLSPIPNKTNLYIVYLLVFVVIFAMYRIENSRVGRAFLAIREDEIAAEAMGIQTTKYKILAFAMGAFCAGLGGALYAHYITYINPIDFGFMKSIEILNMVVLGGMGSIPGTIIGASLLTLAPETLRFVDEYRMLFYGAMLIALMIFRPNGLLGGVNFRNLVFKTFKLNRSSQGK
ncbi:branched-chain amino acid ABC transporter permease [Bacillota bacterium LX-D]|nr:branched-chain amino acid ABC transporter permease [Bacillota bacterium LX-D]